MNTDTLIFFAGRVEVSGSPTNALECLTRWIILMDDCLRLIDPTLDMVVGVAAIHVDVNEHTRPLPEKYNCQCVEIEA